MPVEFRIDVARRRVDVTAFGELNDADLRGHLVSLHAHPDFHPGFDVRADLSGITALRVTSDGVRELAHDRRVERPGRCAVVASADEVFGVARMFELLSEEQADQVRVFRENSEAEAWLDCREGRAVG